MTLFDASPQLTLVKKLHDAYRTLDVKNVEPLISKNFQYYPLPESMGLPKEERREHIQRIGRTFQLFSKIEVCIHHRRNCPQARRLTPTTPRLLIMK